MESHGDWVPGNDGNHSSDPAKPRLRPCVSSCWERVRRPPPELLEQILSILGCQYKTHRGTRPIALQGLLQGVLCSIGMERQQEQQGNALGIQSPGLPERTFISAFEWTSA